MPPSTRFAPIVTLSALIALGCSGGGALPELGGDTMSWDVSFDDAGALPEEFPMRVGHYWPAGAPFRELIEGQELEIVQGFQGGVHLEVAFEIDLGLDYAETQIVYFDLAAQTLLNGEEPVAELQLANFKAGNMGLGVFRSQTVPIVFEQNQAHHYLDRSATLFVSLTLDGKESARAISLNLIDTGDETTPP